MIAARAAVGGTLDLELERLRLVVRRRLMWLQASWGGDPLGAHPALVVTDERAARLAAGDDRAAERAFAAEHEPAAALTEAIAAIESDLRARGADELDRLAERFGLTRLDRDVLVLALAPSLDAAFERLYAYLHDDASRPFPTPQLALDLFGPDDRDRARARLAPEAPLRTHGLVALEPGGSFATRELRVDERVVHHLGGRPGIDGALGRVLRPLEPAPLSERRERLADTVATAARALPWPPAIAVRGPAGSGRRAFAAAVAARLGLTPRLVDADALRDPGAAALRVAIEREAVLCDLAIVIDAREEEPAKLAGDLRAPVIAFGGDRPAGPRDPLAVTLERPAGDERRELWRAALGDRDTDPDRLAAEFRLAPEAVAAAVAMADRRAALQRGVAAARAGEAELRGACRELARWRAEGLAAPLVPTVDWDDIVLPAPLRAQLMEIAAQAANRGRVYHDWGFARATTRGQGITALFAGPSGTGKTMAAEVLAGALDLDLYRIDLAGVVSKYIGETEKNLRTVFDAADDSGAILLFDEADALFGKRTEVKDSHDRYANIEVDYLLQRMESYRGLALLATNRKRLLDPAFLRRLRFVLDFPFPSEADRRRMWSRAFPPAAPIGDLDLDALARLEVAGGSIRTIALNAAFLAAAGGGRVGMPELMQAARREYEKLGRPPAEEVAA